MEGKTNQLEFDNRKLKKRLADLQQEEDEREIALKEEKLEQKLEVGHLKQEILEQKKANILLIDENQFLKNALQDLEKKHATLVQQHVTCSTRTTALSEEIKMLTEMQTNNLRSDRKQQLFTLHHVATQVEASECQPVIDHTEGNSPLVGEIANVTADVQITTEPVNRLSWSEEILMLKPVSTKPKSNVKIIGDSHARGIALELQSILPTNFKVTGVCMPNAKLDTVLAHLGNTLGPDDHMVIIGGSNDLNRNDCPSINFEKIYGKAAECNVYMAEVPYRYNDDYTFNNNVFEVNKTIHEFSSAYNVISTSYLDRKYYTKKGIHLNWKGKAQFARMIQQKILENLEWKKDSNKNTMENTVEAITETASANVLAGWPLNGREMSDLIPISKDTVANHSTNVISVEMDVSVVALNKSMTNLELITEVGTNSESVSKMTADEVADNQVKVNDNFLELTTSAVVTM